MLKEENRLYVLHDNNGVFSDFTKECMSFSRDTVTVNYDYTEDFVYVGFRKPINAFYIEVDHASHAGDDTLEVSYWNGTAWTDVVGLLDDTDNFDRAGFVRWDRNQTDEESTTVNSQIAYWYRILVGNCTHNFTIDGLNIVFADDEDLKTEFYEISSFLPNGASSHILTHVAARDEIIQKIRNDGRYKRNLNTGKFKDISAYDLLDVGQINKAAIYLALSKIFFQVSDQPDDSYKIKSIDYERKYKEAVDVFFLNLDVDDDGIEDTFEEQLDYTTTIYRR